LCKLHVVNEICYAFLDHVAVTLILFIRIFTVLWYVEENSMVVC
jgi:hypothetical protein